MENVPQQTLLKWRQIADLLVRLTLSGKLVWESTAVTGKYITSFGDKTVAISEVFGESKFGESSPLVRIQILNWEAVEIDSFSDEDLEGNYFSVLRDLVRKIERDVSGADLALDEILTSLQYLDSDVDRL